MATSRPMVRERWLAWGVRVAWALLPLVAGGSLGAAVHDWEAATRTTASALLWAGWAIVALATVVRFPVGLTVLRIGAPAALGLTAAAASPGAAAAFAAVALVFRPEVAEWFVNGPAYPNERRLPLRVPASLLLGPMWAAGLVVVAAPAGAALLLAERRWLAGAFALVAGGALAAVAARALHGLSRRWVVFVPAGVVLHDPLSVADPVLFPREVIESLHAAPADTDSLDLTQGALGLALELVLLEKVPVVLRRGRHEEGGASARLLFTPTRPGRVLAEAGRRRVPQRLAD